jgi:hypothetical protein
MFPTVLKLFSVNCGKVSRTAIKNNPAPAMISSTTLRYVTVFHAMWYPGLRVSKDTLTKTLLKPYGDV